MAKCININHPDYIDLLQQSGLHEDILKAKISIWMDENGVDMFPSLDELGIEAVNEMLSKQDLRAAKILGEANLSGIYAEQAQLEPAKTLQEIAQQAQGIMIDSDGNVTEHPNGGQLQSLIEAGIPQSVIDKAIEMFPKPSQLSPISNMKSGVLELFESNPELANIGTPQQYSNYLDTIFPDSKVKDIKQHATEAEFELFTKEGSGRLGKGFYFSDFGNNYIEGENVKKKLVLLNIKNPLNIQGGQFMKDVYKLLDDRNQSSDDVDAKIQAQKDINNQYKQKADALIGDKNGVLNSEIKVFEPSQIHILGSKQDIEGFKNWTENTYQLVTNDKIDEQIASEKTIRDLASRLSDRIGIHVKFISDRSKQYKGKLRKNLGGWDGVNVSIKDVVAEINLAYATLDTPIHEILGHPIIRAIKGGYISQNKYITSEIEITQKLLNKEITREEAKKLREQRDNSSTSQLYQNLLKELEYGKGKEVLDRIKRDYNSKLPLIDYSDIREQTSGELKGKFVIYDNGSYVGKENTLESAKQYVDEINEKRKYTLEEQQEEAIVELLGLMTAEKLDNVKDGKLISLLKRLLKEVKQFVRSLINQKEVEIDKLPDNMTLGDIADLLAYSNSKLILPGNEVVYTTPDNQQFKTYAEASKHISDLAKSVEDVDLSENISIENIDKQINELQKELDNFKFEVEPFNKFVDVYTKQGRLRQNYWAKRKDGTTGWTGGAKETLTDDDYDGFVLDTNRGDGRFITKISDEEAEKIYYAQENKFNITTKESREKYAELETKIHNLKNNSLKGFIEKNKEYEQSKEIIEEWKKVNNIQYNPEEVYSRGQEFVSVVGAYSDFDINLMMQNLLHHIEDNQKAGGEFTVSAFTKPIDRTIGHLEGGGGKIKFKIYPQSQDIKWASNTDVYSGSVWDASKKVSKGKKSELLGVSYSKYPNINNVSKIQPNLASIIDDIAHYHNELGITLTGKNFRLEYDDNIPYSTKKIIDSINSILDQKYGKLIKPKISKKVLKSEKVYEVRWKTGGVITRTTDLNEAKAKMRDKYIDSQGNEVNPEDVVELVEGNPIEQIGIQPTQTNESLKESIESVKDKKIQEYEYTLNPITKEKYDKAVEKSYADSKGIIGEFTEDGETYYVDINDTVRYRRSAEGYFEELATLKPKEYTSQALINTKIAKLKEAAKKYPRSLIRSEVVPIKTQGSNIRTSSFEDEDLSFQKVPSEKLLDNLQFKKGDC